MKKICVINTEIQKKNRNFGMILIMLYLNDIFLFKVLFINLIKKYYVRKISEISGR